MPATNVSTIEDVLENILGLVLGGAAGAYNLAGAGGEAGAGKSGIKEAFRPSFVAGSKWLLAQASTLTHTGSWSPEYNKDAVTFYRWYDDVGATKKITRLTVWVGDKDRRDNTAGQEHNYVDPSEVVNAEQNPVIALGNAWERVRDEIPKVAGTNTSFDPVSLMAVQEVLAALTLRAMAISNQLESQIKLVNSKDPEFKGSAESAWYERVRTANRFLGDLATQHTRWNTALGSMVTAAKEFNTALYKATENWHNITPVGTWQHPYRVIVSMFNGSTLQYGHTGDNPSGAWDIGSQYSNAASKYTFEDDGDAIAPSVLWTPPSWVGYQAFDAFNTVSWAQLEVHLRKKWIDNLVNTFKPVLTEAAQLVEAFGGARNQLYISDPEPLPPPPMPNDFSMLNGGGLGNYDPFANIGDPFANWRDPFANWGDPFANFGDPFANFSDPFANWGDPFANGLGGGGFGGLGDDPFANGGDGMFVKLNENDPFANGGDGLGGGFVGMGGPDSFANGPGGLGGGFLGLGGPDSFANGGDGPGGAFSRLNMPDPFANGPGGLGGGFLGLGGPDSFANGGGGPGGAFSRLGLEDPFANDAALDPGFGVGGNSGLGLGNLGSPSASLGDLTPEQLRQLDSAGLLDKIPLSPEQADFLRRNGLGVPGGTSPTLGQLSPEQLEALQRAGLLDEIPLTPGQRANLGLPSGAGGASQLPSWQNLPVDSSKFPTTIDGVDVSKPPSKSGAGMVIGDVTRPGAGADPSIPGMVVGTGGLSGVPGLSGSPGGLSAAGLGLSPVGLGTSGGAGTGAGLSGGSGAPGSAGLSGGASAGGMGGGMGGMPFMPPMMGGPGMGGRQQDRDRQRNTWLKEEEEVWGTDPDCAPAVIGRRRRPGQTEEEQYPTPGDEWNPTQDERRPYRRR